MRSIARGVKLVQSPERLKCFRYVQRRRLWQLHPLLSASTLCTLWDATQRDDVNSVGQLDDRRAVTGRRASTMHRKNAAQPRQIQRCLLALARFARQSSAAEAKIDSCLHYLRGTWYHQAAQFYLTPHVCTEVQRWFSSSVDMPLSVCVWRLQWRRQLWGTGERAPLDFQIWEPTIQVLSQCSLRD